MIVLWESIQFVVFLFELMIMFRFLKNILLFKNIKFTKIGMLLTSIICYFITSINLHGIITIIGIYSVIFVSIYIFFEGSIFKKIFGFGSFMFINIVSENFIVLFYYFVLNIPISKLAVTDGDTFIRLTAIILAKILLFIAVTIHTQRNNSDLNMMKITNNKRLLFGIVFIFLIVTLITVLILDINIKLDALQINLTFPIYLLTLSISVLSILCIIIYEGILDETENQLQLELQMQQNESKYKYNQEMSITVDSIRGIKHDISNHLAVISGYIQSDNCKQAEQYIKKLTQPMESLNALLNIEHQVFSSILYVKTVTAQKYDINMGTKIDLKEELFIEDMDITILIGNLLDNAIEATQSIGKNQDKRIVLSIKTKERYLIIDCENTMNPNKINHKESKFVTTKRDIVNHGLGLKNVERVVTKYNGNMDIKAKDNQFRINITLNNLQENR